MSARYDVVVIGSGLGGLTAAALLARAGRKTLVIERNNSVGGAASTYKVGDLVVEASLHETSDPRDPTDPKHHILKRIDVLDAVQWVATGALYEVRGGPVGEPFILPESFSAANSALGERFPGSRAGIATVLGDMERIATGLGILSQGKDAFRNPRSALGAMLKLVPVVRDWRRSVSDVFERSLAQDEAAKCALAANLAYYHDDPNTLWWIFFAVAQGGYLASGGRYVHGGSQVLSNALAQAIRAAGGEILLRRTAIEIRLNIDGRATSVVHVGDNGERATAETRVVVSNAAPDIAADLLPQSTGEKFRLSYARHRLSISLFSLMLGLSRRPAEFGIRAYSNFLLPSWMKQFGDYAHSGDLLASAPSGMMPLMTVVDYSAIDAGLGGPPYPVSVVGPDRVENWSGLDRESYVLKRKQWLAAILAAIDQEFPDLSSHVVATSFSTARSLGSYLNAPHGAVYGFAPVPPATPIWKGLDRSPNTPIHGLYLASSYAGSGGFTGAIMAGGTAADLILAET